MQSSYESLILEVYPHVCGATVLPNLPSFVQQGLSPRVWGNLRCERWIQYRYRSIPTCVGQPWQGPGVGLPLMVYPHVCGATRC